MHRSRLPSPQGGYPASPTVIAAQMDALLENIPAADQAAARRAMLAYGQGDALGHYDRDWHFAKAEAIDRWRKKYGGAVHVQCVEFGCFDAIMAKKRFGGPGESLRIRRKAASLTQHDDAQP